MPLAYGSGTIAEHLAVRKGVGIFDVSHLGTVEVAGSNAFDLLQANFTNDLRKIGPGRAQYTHLLELDGSVLDDIIVWWLEPELFHVMPNAANTENVRRTIGGRDITGDRCVIAVQGPKYTELLNSVAPGWSLPGRNRIVEASYQGELVRISGTGYTGSPGVEIAVSNDKGPQLFRELIERGAIPCGLGARDTLRLEAGLPLHGHELGKGLTPLNANLGWVVAFSKGPFPGREALKAQLEHGIDPVLKGLTTGTRQPLRTGEKVWSGDREAGYVSSGGFSPVLGTGIGLAYLHPDFDVDLLVTRGERRVPVKLVNYPFIDLKQTD
jgi:aminomethyltransferase